MISIGKSIGLAAGIVGGLYLYSIAPNKSRKEQMRPFEQQYIAHRGLFDNAADCPENSLPAFRRAVEHHYGIELDVQLTKDRQLVVFHDESLLRMCGVDKKLRDCTYQELCQYPLASSQERIPLFDQVLEVIDGQVPLVVEVKPEGDWETTTRKMAERMDKYPGCYCMESFHPFAVKWFRDHRPDVIRGQLSTDYRADHIQGSPCRNFLLSNLMLNWASRPDFVAYNHRWKDNFSYTLCRKMSRVENVAWTIKNQQELDRAEKTFDVIIFDSFLPAEKHPENAPETP